MLAAGSSAPHQAARFATWTRPPGGSYRIERTADGQKYVALGEYCEVMRPSRIVFTFAMPQFAADVDTVTIEIEPEGPRSQLRMNQAGLRPEYEEATRAGWTEMFDLLEQVLAETLRQGGRLRQARRQGRPGDRIESVAG